ncbi:hypothetical protein AAH991_17965 [Microbispora sp. ZYX-F-249]|uniref:Uncharacterized protein n=1 Tax=Microbispora maris TaxID=3144104 RepID=A0ABV0AP08_9ACTN
MHRKSRQLALAAIVASTFTAGGIALLGGTASAATGAPQAGEPGGSVRATSYTISEPLLATESASGARTISAPLFSAPLITESASAFAPGELPATSLVSQAPQLTVSMPQMSLAALPRTVSVTVREQFPAQWSARQYSGSSLHSSSWRSESLGGASLRSEAFPSASMEQMAEEARQSIRDEASSARQQIMQEATNAQQRIEQMSLHAQQQLSETQSQSSASQSQSSSSLPQSAPESAPESALGSAPESLPPTITGPESAPPAGIPETSIESSSSSSSEACQ